MSQRAQTKDQRYIEGLFELARAAGNMEAGFDMNEVGAHVGISPRGVKTIVALLARANFVKKLSKTQLCITVQGEQLVNRLRVSA